MRKNGERVWVAWTNRAIRDAQGRTAEVLCVGNDITARRQAAEDLRRAHEQLEARVEERTAALSQANTVLQREIAERNRVEAELRERVAFENIITTISTKFINLAPEGIDDGINEALGTIGEFAGVDRSYVFIFSPDGEVMNNTHEWSARGIEPQRENLQGIPSTALPWWTAHIRQSRGDQHRVGV